MPNVHGIKKKKKKQRLHISIDYARGTTRKKNSLGAFRATAAPTDRPTSNDVKRHDTTRIHKHKVKCVSNNFGAESRERGEGGGGGT